MADQSRPEGGTDGGTGGVGECLGGQQKGLTFSHSAEIEVDQGCLLQIQNQELAPTYKTSLLGCLVCVVMNRHKFRGVPVPASGIPSHDSYNRPTSGQTRGHVRSPAKVLE